MWDLTVGSSTRRNAPKRPPKPCPPAYLQILHSDADLGRAPAHETRPHAHSLRPLAPCITRAGCGQSHTSSCRALLLLLHERQRGLIIVRLLLRELSQRPRHDLCERCAAYRRLTRCKRAHKPHITRTPCRPSANRAWCLSYTVYSQPAQGGSRALLGLRERAERRQGASGRGSGRQAGTGIRMSAAACGDVRDRPCARLLGDRVMQMHRFCMRSSCVSCQSVDKTVLISG